MILASTALLWGATLLPPAQDLQASAELFVRPAPAPAASGEVQAAIRVRIAPGWHLYHFELGQPDAVGKPTKVSFTSGGEWSEVRFPEPLRIEQPGLGEGGRDTWIWAHEGSIVLYAAGRIPADAQPAQVALTITGLTCEDQGSCIPYKEQLTSAGAGTDALFATFPQDLHAPGAQTSGGEPGAATQTGAASKPSAPSKSFDASGKGWGSKSASDQKAEAKLYVRRVGDAIRAAIEIQIEPGWHLYHGTLGPPDAVGKPTRVQLSGAGIEWDAVVFPEAKRINQPGVGEGGRDTWILGHEGRLVLSATGRAASSNVDLAAVRATISGSTCEDGGSCIDYREEIASSGAGPDELFASSPAPGSNTASSSGATNPSGTNGVASDGHPVRKSLAGFLMLAVFWGLFTLLMPCTYPMIPITISFFTKQASARDGNTLSLSLLYGLGIVAVFILIGVAFGSVIIPFATHPITNLVIGAFFVFFSLVLFGAVDLQPPRMLMDAAGKASMTGGYLGVFLMGVTLVVTSFTCTAPFVGSLLAVGAADGNLLRIVLGMGVFGLTMAVPFVLLSMLPKKIQALPRSGEWMHVLKVFLGFVELAAALKFLSNTDLVWGWGVLSRELFLLLWMGIFLVAGLFLFGMIRLKGEKAIEIGPLRMVGATLVFLFALYCGYGMLGHSLDTIMTAIVPNYSSSLAGGDPASGEGSARAAGHEIIKDDYEGALARAREQGKLLLVNFTGFT